MTHGTVVLISGIPVDLPALDLLVRESGWSLKEAHGVRGLAELNAKDSVVTVLFDPRNLELPWNHALRAVLDTAPKALPILCHGFADAIEWADAAEAGAFHLLRLPFDLSEVRQSPGFVSARRAAPHPRRFSDARAEEPSFLNKDDALAAKMVA